MLDHAIVGKVSRFFNSLLKITDQELERESGGTGLRYSFDILSGKVTQEVGVDAMTGKLLENKAEGPNPD